MIDPGTISRNQMEPVFAVDRDGVIVFANRRFLEITQLARDDVVGTDVSLFERIVEAGFDETRTAVDAINRGETEEERVELSMCHPVEAPAPRRLPAEVRVTPLIEAGEHVGALLTLRNITERKEREQELYWSHRRFEAVFDSPDSFIAVLDPDGTVENVNRAALEFIGMDAEAIEGESFWETSWWTHSAELQDQLREWIDVAADGDHVRFEATHYAADGEKLIADGVVRPVTGDDETVASLIVESRDITTRKRREEEVARKNRRLEEFTSVVSHDLRNPLTVAKGRTELARKEGDDEHLAAAETAIDRGLALIDELLTIAREGDGATEVETVDLAEVVEGSWRTVATADATLVADLNRRIRANRSRLKQLLENLIGNAVDHGGPDVTVTVGETANGFFVADDGPGIPDSERETIFEVGYSTAEDGTGFGLGIVDDIAADHDWTVTVTDAEDGGARFDLTGVTFVD